MRLLGKVLILFTFTLISCSSIYHLQTSETVPKGKIAGGLGFSGFFL
jgi:hypothetical protein